jgi:hypothetical protein
MPFVLSVAGDDDVVVLTDPAAAVDLVLRLVRRGRRPIGVGAGPVTRTRGRPDGPAAVAAGTALAAAARRPGRVAVRGMRPVEALDAQAVLAALAALVGRRSAAAWAAVDLLAGGRTQAGAATALGVSRQAVGQRLAAGGWELECELRSAAARLLARAES